MDETGWASAGIPARPLGRIHRLFPDPILPDARARDGRSVLERIVDDYLSYHVAREDGNRTSVPVRLPG